MAESPEPESGGEGGGPSGSFSLVRYNNPEVVQTEVGIERKNGVLSFSYQIMIWVQTLETVDNFSICLNLNKGLRMHNWVPH